MQSVERRNVFVNCREGRGNCLFLGTNFFQKFTRNDRRNFESSMSVRVRDEGAYIESRIELKENYVQRIGSVYYCLAHEFSIGSNITERDQTATGNNR